MYTMSESPSRYEDLVNILPKTRYVHIESPSRHVKNADCTQRAPPQIKVFGHLQLLTCKVVYIFNIRPSHIYTCFNRVDVGCEVLDRHFTVPPTHLGLFEEGFRSKGTRVGILRVLEGWGSLHATWGTYSPKSNVIVHCSCFPPGSLGIVTSGSGGKEYPPEPQNAQYIFYQCVALAFLVLRTQIRIVVRTGVPRYDAKQKIKLCLQRHRMLRDVC